MKKYIFLTIALVVFQFCLGQITYKNFNSQKLGEERAIKIQLPRSYHNSSESYPIIVVLDGDYMFEIVAANADYYSYWDNIPETIVVGINQFDKREADTLYSETTGTPIDTGLAFSEFISSELIPYIDKTYRTDSFKAIVGHGETANFINYFLLKNQPFFNAYLAISPELSPNITKQLSEKLPKIQNKVFYYLATSDKDIKAIQKGAKELNAALSTINNENITTLFNDFEGPSHYSLPATAIPQALEDIFMLFRPISKKEYKEKILKSEKSPVDYLLTKYKVIKEWFNIDKPILINDFKATAAAINKKKDFEHFEALAKLASKQYPNTLLGNYYLGRFYEETGDPKKAMKIYQSAYILEEIAGITKDHVLELSEQIKADFGY